MRLVNTGKRTPIKDGNTQKDRYLSKWTLSIVILTLVIPLFLQRNSSYTSPISNSEQLGVAAFIEGRVSSKSTGEPIVAASIEIQEFGLKTSTNFKGQFEFPPISTPETVYPIQVTIRATGYGDWTMTNVALVADDTLILDAVLASEPVTIKIPDIEREKRFGSETTTSFSPNDLPSLDQTSLPLPETIRVRVTNNVAVCDQNPETNPYTVEVIDFNEYVKDVLPAEWGYGWPRESYRAGAMAVKMYAWQLISIGGKYDDADVYDSICDQVYIPGYSYSSTNNAIDFTWNWRLTHADGSLFRTHYLDWYWRCEDYEWQGFCMGQNDTRLHALGNDGYDKLTWDEMLFRYYDDSRLSYVPTLPPAEFMLRFFGSGWGDIDRIKIPVDDPIDGDLPVDIGDTDFTIEFWMLALASDNASQVCQPDADQWANGSVIFDRDVDGDGDYGEYGISLMNGSIAFGIRQGGVGLTLCGIMGVADERWHHVAITRNTGDGLVRIFVDGQLDAEAIGPSGDISYRDGRTTTSPDQDPYLVLGARKADQGLAYAGYLDEIRISTVVRYSDAFQRPSGPFVSDPDTVALFHLNIGYGNAIFDSSEATGGPSDGIRLFGGDPDNGPEWMLSDLYLFIKLFIPTIVN